jgi:hypothetical protein
MHSKGSSQVIYAKTLKSKIILCVKEICRPCFLLQIDPDDNKGKFNDNLGLVGVWGSVQMSEKLLSNAITGSLRDSYS